MKNTVRKYWIEILLIVGYLVADNLHMVVKELNYVPKWYHPYNPEYHFYDAVYYFFHYLCGISVFTIFIILITSPKDLTKVWLRLSLFIVSLRDFIGDFFEIINLYIPNFGNYGYNAGTYVKIFFLLAALIIAFIMKKMCMRLINYIRSD